MAGLSASLPALLKEPFGPYWEPAALTKAVNSTSVKNPIPLRCVTLVSGGVYTGLSECDSTMLGYETDRFTTDPPQFMGILEIRHLSWLSPEVIKEIEAELRERDVRARRSPNNPRPQPSNCTLKSIYARSPGFHGNNHKVKVKIQTRMGGTASYLHSAGVPDGLRLTSDLPIPGAGTRTHRSYVVESMFFNTYALSRLYLARWRVLRVLRDIVELDRTSSEEQTAIDERTPEWFIDRYLQYFAHHSSGRTYRAIYTDSDSDIEPDTGGRLINGREHVLRHVSRAEISSILAEHAEWLIYQTYLTPRVRQSFDPGSWRKQWLPHVRVMREQAGAAGRPWGVWHGEEKPTEYDMEIDDIPWPASANIKRKKTAKKPKKSAASAAMPSGPAYGGYDEDGMDVDDPNDYYDPTTQRVYDSDFTCPSSDIEAPPTTDEDDDFDAGLTPLTDPDIIALIPPSFRHLPPPPASHKWKCTECDYMIDLLNLTQHDLDNPRISYDTRRRLQSKNWNMFTKQDLWAYEAFLDMVDKHHQVHLDERGIELRRVRGGYVAVWKDGRRPQSCRLRQVMVDNRRQKAIVKEEGM